MVKILTIPQNKVQESSKNTHSFGTTGIQGYEVNPGSFQLQALTNLNNFVGNW
jgi:hypothetical protein